MTARPPSRVVVAAPARLHLGFIDLNGACGRMFGSIGVAVERPRYVVEACPARETEVRGEAIGEVLRVARAIRARVRLPSGIALRVRESIPRHRGFGSGTQRDLAVGTALSVLAGRALPVRDLARLVGRGRRSGIGVAGFDRGGLVVDGGVRRGRGGDRIAPANEGLPPVLFQAPVPPSWHFVLAIPPGVEGLSGPAEDEAFRRLGPMTGAAADRISRLVLMGLLPAVLGDDVGAFGAALAEIQQLVGQYFAPLQGGSYASERGHTIAEFARKQGAVAVGQSSWGPAVFALVRGAAAARGLLAKIETYVGDPEVAVINTRVRNRGASVRIDR